MQKTAKSQCKHKLLADCRLYIQLCSDCDFASFFICMCLEKYTYIKLHKTPISGSGAVPCAMTYVQYQRVDVQS